MVTEGPARRSSEWTGRTVNIATDAVERSAAYRATFLGSMIGSMVSPALVLVVIAVALDAPAAGWLALALPLVPLVIGGFQSAFRSVSSRYRAASRRLSAQYLDSLQGLATLRGLGAGRHQGRVLAQEAENVRRNVMRLLAGNQSVLFISDAVFSLAMITLGAVLAVQRVSSGVLTLGQGVSLVLLATLLTEPLDRIGQFFYIGMGGIAARKEIRAFLSAPSVNGAHALGGETPEAGAKAGNQASEPEAAEVVDGPQPGASSVELRQVSFAYPDGTEVLADATLEVAPAERVALVGRSGAGKTTILELVQGTWHPTSGTVAVCGVDVADVPAAWVRRQIGVVAQSTYLFTGTLAYNLRLARPDATEDELWRALDDAHLSDEVRQWPARLDTAVGERGLAVSGGQAQRIAVARALLKDAPVLLLDEPTSQVDLESEAAILAALDRLVHGRTVITVAHRAAAVASAERVVAVTDGHLRDVTERDGGR